MKSSRMVKRRRKSQNTEAHTILSTPNQIDCDHPTPKSLNYGKNCLLMTLETSLKTKILNSDLYANGQTEIAILDSGTRRPIREKDRESMFGANRIKMPLDLFTKGTTRMELEQDEEEQLIKMVPSTRGSTLMGRGTTLEFRNGLNLQNGKEESTKDITKMI